MFANPLGLLTLLGIPILLAIHFLQRKSVSLPISTLFLLDRTQREATAGRRFERLIPSVPLWMQILAVLLLAYFLAEPRFQKENSVQRVAVVLDSSASMTVFKQDAIAALKEKLPTLQGSASSLELTLIPATPGADRLYTGSSVADLISTFEEYTPTGGVLDPSYALRLARSIVSNEGTVIYLTDTPAETLPYESSLIAVGKPTENVGFTGISFEETQGALTFQAIIRNYGETPQTRSWTLQSSTGSSEPKSFDIAPGAFISIQAAFPENTENVRLQLTPDSFTLDDTLPIVAPAPKSLDIFTATSPAFQDLTEKLIRSLAATRPSADAATSDLVITSYDPLDPALPQTNAVLFVEDPTSSGKYLKGGILAEASPLMEGVNWQALLVRETLQLPRNASDRVLLWQEKRPLIFLRQLGDQQILCFNFDLRLSNATQQPAFVVLLHRFAESIRARKVAPQILNLETSQPIRIATAPEGKISVQATTPTGEPAEAPTANTAPPVPGFLTITQADQPILTAAVHFADIREADLSTCGTATANATVTRSALRQHTAPDPLSRLWLLVILVALLIAWHYTQSKTTPSRTPAPSH